MLISIIICRIEDPFHTEPLLITQALDRRTICFGNGQIRMRHYRLFHSNVCTTCTDSSMSTNNTKSPTSCLISRSLAPPLRITKELEAIFSEMTYTATIRAKGWGILVPWPCNMLTHKRHPFLMHIACSFLKTWVFILCYLEIHMLKSWNRVLHQQCRANCPKRVFIKVHEEIMNLIFLTLCFQDTSHLTLASSTSTAYGRTVSSQTVPNLG